jgi:glutamate-1-semialdehyde 2,1-aminomutase
VRLARAHTSREHVAVCGYHGWQDWYIGSTSRNLGVPDSTRALTHRFNYNDASSLEAVFDENPDSVAAVIMEPMNMQWPADGFLEAVRDLAHDHGALLIFDEIITGCRFAIGGAQTVFGVTPDLCTFGKGLANGLPLSAVMGRRDVMRLMEDVFLSGTFGGETLALAAARAVLDKLQREPVIETLAARGTEILDGLAALFDRHDLGGIFETAGHPSWSFLVVRDAPSVSPWEIRTLLLQELFARGILCLGSHNLSYAHSPQDVATLLETYEEVLPAIRDAVSSGSVKDRLRAEPLVPLFQVR